MFWTKRRRKGEMWSGNGSLARMVQRVIGCVSNYEIMAERLRIPPPDQGHRQQEHERQGQGCRDRIGDDQ
jgi:hypothetical protein